jgi:Zn-dependent peptidase ImmA (M78 family)
MSMRPDERIRKRRRLLQDPYAYLNGEGGFDTADQARIQDVHAARYALENPWAHLDGDGGFAGLFTKADITAVATPIRIDVTTLLGAKRQGEKFSRQEIGGIARKLQIELWRRRHEFYPNSKTTNPTDVLDPIFALTAIGYSVQEHDSLGEYFGRDGAFEVAGILDKPTATARISKRFSHPMRNFTMAHELGHAILHDNIRMHRDRPFDGALNGQKREATEIEADVFASLFLLPEKLVRAAFERRFLAKRVVINEETAFALGERGVSSLFGKYRSRRDFSRMMANAAQYNGVHFRSLAENFGASTEVMAIRLEELNLV